MIGLDYSIDPSEEHKYTLDLILDTLGLPFLKNIDSGKANLDHANLIITYGKPGISEPLSEFVRNGGCVINIPNYRNLEKEQKHLQNKGYEYKQLKTLGLFGYLETNNKLELPLIFPFFYRNDTGNGSISLKFTHPDELKDCTCLDAQEIGKGLYVSLGIDIISTVFHILTLQTERKTNNKDSYGRLLEEENLLLQNKAQMIPWVNNYFLFLEDLIKYCYAKMGLPLLQKWYWPDNHEFAMWVSHDIDEVKKYTWKKIAFKKL
jgi:hypothetical protein